MSILFEMEKEVIADVLAIYEGCQIYLTSPHYGRIIISLPADDVDDLLADLRASLYECTAHVSNESAFINVRLGGQHAQ